MQVGFASLIGLEPLPFAQLMQWAGHHGVRTVEVNVGPAFPVIGEAGFPGHLNLNDVIERGPDSIREILDGSGVEISSLAPMVNALVLDPELRAKRMVVIQQSIDACAMLGVSTVITFTGSAFGMHFAGLPGVGDGHSSNRTDENLAIFTDVYTDLANYAYERGVRIAFETAGRGGGEGNLAHSPELWERMFDAVPSPALGLSFDPSHLVWLGIPNAPDLVRRFADRIFHVDGKDTEILDGRLAEQGILGSGWWRYRLPGMGQVDWRGIISALMDIEYDGAISIENEDPLMQGRDGVLWAKRYLDQFVMPLQTAGTPVN